MTMQPGRDRRMVWRGVLFAVVCVGCVVAAWIYVRTAMTRERLARRSAERSAAAATVSSGKAPTPAGGPLILFTNLAGDSRLRYRIALAPIAAPDGPRALADLVCERIYFAGGHGVCLGEDDARTPLEDGVSETHAYAFDADFHITHDIALGGVPSRVRVSPDGRVGAVTVFVAGHSYADSGFSTATTLIDLESGRRLGNLERFAVWRDGHRWHSVDFNFWGVTFVPPGDRFYATLSSGGHTYLVAGSVAAGRMQVVRENVECPSASPDGTRLAFKSRLAGTGAAAWRVHVLDLATMNDIALAEPRSIDDQIEWLDSGQVLYSADGAIWTSNADGSGTPRRFLSQASSPAVLRDAGAVAALSHAAPTGLTLPVAELAVSVRASADAIALNQQVTYTVTVVNHGPADASSLRVDIVLGAGLAPVGVPTATNPGQGYGCSSRDAAGQLSCDTAALGRGGTWTVSFTARGVAAGSNQVQVIVSGAEADADPANDRAVSRTTVQPAG